MQDSYAISDFRYFLYLSAEREVEPSNLVSAVVRLFFPNYKSLHVYLGKYLETNTQNNDFSVYLCNNNILFLFSFDWNCLAKNNTNTVKVFNLVYTKFYNVIQCLWKKFTVLVALQDGWWSDMQYQKQGATRLEDAADKWEIKITLATKQLEN